MCSKLIAGLAQLTYPHPAVSEIHLPVSSNDLDAIRLAMPNANSLGSQSYVVDMLGSGSLKFD